MFLSQYAHAIRLNKNNYVVYNAFLFQPVLLTKQEWQSVRQKQYDDFSKNDIKLLREKGILIDTKQQDNAIESFLKTSLKERENQISLLYLIPYGGCNLACKYCFIGQIDNQKARFMSLETADIAVQKFANHIQKNKIQNARIVFYGGEPTLNFPVIEFVAKKIKENHYPITLSMISNGTALTDEMIDFCKKHQIAVGISLDGPEYINDANRIFKSGGNGSYQQVIQSIHKLKKSHIDFAISLTLSPTVLDTPVLLDWLKDLDVKNVNFNLMHYTHADTGWKSYYQKASAFLFRAYDFLNPLNIKDDRLLRKFRSFYGHEFKYNDCAAVSGQQLTVKPNGSITVCHGYWNHTKEDCGHIHDVSFQDVFQSPIYQKWKTNLTIYKKTCLKCPAIYICGGGCPKQSESLFGNQTKIDKPFCIHTKYALKELFKRHFLEKTKE